MEFDFEILKYINHPYFCRTYTKYLRMKHGAPYLLCLFNIEERRL